MVFKVLLLIVRWHYVFVLSTGRFWGACLIRYLLSDPGCPVQIEFFRTQKEELFRNCHIKLTIEREEDREEYSTAR